MSTDPNVAELRESNADYGKPVPLPFLFDYDESGQNYNSTANCN